MKTFLNGCLLLYVTIIYYTIALYRHVYNTSMSQVKGIKGHTPYFDGHRHLAFWCLCCPLTFHKPHNQGHDVGATTYPTSINVYAMWRTAYRLVSNTAGQCAPLTNVGSKFFRMELLAYL